MISKIICSLIIIQIIQMSSIKAIQSAEAHNFTNIFTKLAQKVEGILETLDSYYEQAYPFLENEQYYFNESIMKQLIMYADEFSNVLKFGKDGIELFLIHKNQSFLSEQVEMGDTQFIQKFRNKMDIVMNQKYIKQSLISKIHYRCSSIKSLTLLPSAALQVTDSNLKLFKPFSQKLSKIAVPSSSITSEGLNFILTTFPHLCEIDLSNNSLINDESLKLVCGYELVTIKLNGCQCISNGGVINLIRNVVSLNYLQIRSPNINSWQIYHGIGEVYRQNELSYKWLQLQTLEGLNLFINKLSYLTHLTTSESITDNEIQLLIGKHPTLNSLYLNNCEQLHSETINFISKNCTKLKKISLQRFTNLTDSQIYQLICSLHKIQLIDLSYCCNVSSRLIIDMANQLSKVKEIVLRKCDNVDDDALGYLVKRMKCIEYLDLGYCRGITDNAVYYISEELSNLKFINLEHCQQITDDSISYMSECLLKLQSLILNYNEGISDTSLSLVALRLKYLKRLELEWCRIHTKSLGIMVENLRELQVVNFSFCGVRDVIVEGIANKLKNIKILKLNGCEKVSSEAFEHLFASLENLTVVSLNQCTQITDKALSGLTLQNRAQLLELDLGWCSKITDTTLFNISMYQHQLLKLTLNGCSLITDTGIEWICSSVRKISKLSLSLCENIGNKAINEVAQNLTNLRILHLSDNHNITDSSISGLSTLTSIEQLHLANCSKLTSSSLISLLHHLQKLQSLDISSCKNINIGSLGMLIQRMVNIKKLQVAELEIKDQFLNKLGKYMKKLRFLNIQYCRRITESGVQKIIGELEFLVRVDTQNMQISEKCKEKIFHELRKRKLYNILS